MLNALRLTFLKDYFAVLESRTDGAAVRDGSCVLGGCRAGGSGAGDDAVAWGTMGCCVGAHPAVVRQIAKVSGREPVWYIVGYEREKWCAWQVKCSSSRDRAISW